MMEHGSRDFVTTAMRSHDDVEVCLALLKKLRPSGCCTNRLHWSFEAAFTAWDTHTHRYVYSVVVLLGRLWNHVPQPSTLLESKRIASLASFMMECCIV